MDTPTRQGSASTRLENDSTRATVRRDGTHPLEDPFGDAPVQLAHQIRIEHRQLAERAAVKGDRDHRRPPAARRSSSGRTPAPTAPRAPPAGTRPARRHRGRRQRRRVRIGRPSAPAPDCRPVSRAVSGRLPECAASSARRWDSRRNPPARPRGADACGSERPAVLRPADRAVTVGREADQVRLAHLLEVQTHGVRVQIERLRYLRGGQRALGAGDLLVDRVARRIRQQPEERQPVHG